MLIFDNKILLNPLPVYDVQEVTMEEALALLKSDLRNETKPLSDHTDNSLPMGSRIVTEPRGLGGSSL